MLFVRLLSRGQEQQKARFLCGGGEGRWCHPQSEPLHGCRWGVPVPCSTPTWFCRQKACLEPVAAPQSSGSGALSSTARVLEAALYPSRGLPKTRPQVRRAPQCPSRHRQGATERQNAKTAHPFSRIPRLARWPSCSWRPWKTLMQNQKEEHELDRRKGRLCICVHIHTWNEQEKCAKDLFTSAWSN